MNSDTREDVEQVVHNVKYGPEELPPMPWFGMDIGGTLAKLVYFEPTDTTDEEEERVKNIRKYLTNNLAYGTEGHRDQQKQMEDLVIRNRKGRLHFIRFPTSVMRAFLDLAKEKGMAETISTVCATGGGAYKFEADIRAELNMSLHKVSPILLTKDVSSVAEGSHVSV